MVGGLADWFAVTALFRHPLGLPIPHTAIIGARRAKIVEGIVSMVENEWLSPDVIGARLRRITPTEIVVDWLRDPVHVERLGRPIRDLIRALAGVLTEDEFVVFVDRTIRSGLREIPLDASVGRLLARVAASESADAAFRAAAVSLVNLARRPQTGAQLERWIDRSARQLHRDGKRLVPLLLRRGLVQRKIVEAVCDYASSELFGAVSDRSHPVRQFVFGEIERFADRLAAGDERSLAQIEHLRAALVESLEASPIILDLLKQLRTQVETDLDDAGSYLSSLVDRKLRAGILDVLDDPEHRVVFDNWVRATAEDLLRRHHHQIGITVKENLDALDTDTLVAQIEERVGADLQFIRLNGALVGGVIGIALALFHLVVN